MLFHNLSFVVDAREMPPPDRISPTGFSPIIFKGYCTINCGMAKSLAQARACEGHLASDLAIPQLILEWVQGIFWVILCVIFGPIRPQKTEYWQ